MISLCISYSNLILYLNPKHIFKLSSNTEDYRGPSAAGYFKWLPDPETGELKPVTRLKEVNVEKKVR